MSIQINSENLDQLLAQPCQIADRGFTEGLCTQLRNKERERATVITSITLCCAALILLFASSVETFGFLSMLDSIYGNLVTGFTQELSLQALTEVVASENSSLPGMVFTIFLVLWVAQQFLEE